MNKRCLTLALFGILQLVRPAALPAQDPEEGEIVFRRRVPFSVDLLSYRGDSAKGTRVDVFLEVPYDALQFVRRGGVFQAQFEIQVTATRIPPGASAPDDEALPEAEQTWKETLELGSIGPTEGVRLGKIARRELRLVPGRYQVEVRLKDMETKRTTRSRLEAVVTDFTAGTWMLSDPMILRGPPGTPPVITPDVRGELDGTSDTIFVYLQQYNDQGADSSDMIWTIESDTAVMKSDSLHLAAPAGASPVILAVPVAGLGAGEYNMRFYSRPAGTDPSGGSVSAVTMRTFTVRWSGMPVEVEDIDLAIDQMQYVLDEDAIDEMKEQEPALKREMWLAFWKKRDPTPESEKNELMEEYYSRVTFANRQFTHYTDGWKSDRGMVYIIFGPPSNIERRPFENNSKPYEVWTYYEQNREFVFVDASGFGDYKLQTPIWDDYETRVR
jgi:GWxTD domain-containing protein